MLYFFVVVHYKLTQKILNMLNQRIIRRAEMLKFRGPKHPVTKVMLVIFEILSNFEDIKEKEEEVARMFSSLGFSREDREYILDQRPRAYWGYGNFDDEDVKQLFQLIRLKDEKGQMFLKYNIILEIFDGKIHQDGEAYMVETVVERLSCSNQCKEVILQICGAYEKIFEIVYDHYYFIR